MAVGKLDMPELYWRDPQNYASNLGNNPTGSSFNYGSLIPALTTLLGTAATLEDIDRQNEATLRNIESLGEQLRFTQAQRSNQISEVDEVLGDKLSMSGLEALKQEATLKAAASETGATGTSNQEVIQNKFVEQNFRDAAMVREARIQKDNLKMQMIADRLSFDNKVDSLQSTMLTPLSAGLKTLGNSLKYFNTGLNLLPTNTRDVTLGIDTKG